MKIQILGSAAAEGWPALFCECDLCKYAWEHHGKDVRRRCAYLLNDDVMIDFGPDAYWQSLEFNIDYSKIDAVFFTHSHADHCNPVEFLWRRRGFSVVNKQLDIYGDQTAINKLVAAVGENNLETYKMKMHTVLPNVPFTFKDYTVMPILAQHASRPEIPLNFIIQDKQGKTALIGNDSGWWCEQSWETLAKYQLDIAVLECTMGPKYQDHDNGHLGTNATVRVRDRLASQGTITGNTLVAVNHFSHNGGGLHKDFEAFFNPVGIQVGYDGMILEK